MRATIAAAALLLTTCASVRPPGGPHDAASLAAFADPLIEAHLREAGIPGAVFVYVKDGRVLYAKGYGYADA
jgi:CubicO group peptidase (beta-lactamase class C family)